MLPRLSDHQAEFVCTHDPILAFHRGLHKSDLLGTIPSSSLLEVILFERLELSFCGRVPRLFLKTVLDTTKTYRSLADQSTPAQGAVAGCMALTTLELPISILSYQPGTNMLGFVLPLKSSPSTSVCVSAHSMKIRHTSGSKILSPCCWRSGDV